MDKTNTSKKGNNLKLIYKKPLAIFPLETAYY